MRHLPVLDGLRAAAIGIVVVSHAGLGWLIPGGFGVTLFFFLSGYLITTILRSELAETGSVDFKQFYLKRAFRILPPMFIAIALAATLANVGLAQRPFYSEYVWTDFLFLSNYASHFGSYSNLDIPLWSLDVEEHFYLLFPIFLLVVWPALRSSTAGVLVAVCLAVLALRGWYVANEIHVWKVYYWSHTRIDSILFGAVLAVWHNPADRPAREPFLHWAKLAIALALILPTFIIRDPFFRETVRYTLQGVGLLFLFSFCIQDRGWVAKLLTWQPFVWLAAISYMLYLAHVPLMKAAGVLIENEALANFVGIVAALLVSQAVRTFVELPIVRIRKRNSAPATHTPVNPNLG